MGQTLGKSKGYIWDCQSIFLLTEHISSHQSTSPPPPFPRRSFPLPSNRHTWKPQRQIYTFTYTLTQQDPEVRLSHCPCTHEVACQLWSSALFTACFRSFYFRSVFPLCKCAHKHRLCLHLSFQCYLLRIKINKNVTLFEMHCCVPTLGLKVSIGCLLFVAI